MCPTINEGDIVIYRRTNSKKFSPKEGSIVVVKDPQDPKNLIIKRIHKANPIGLELRGDNESNSIDSRQFGLVNRNHLHGVVEAILPQSDQRSF